MKVRIKIDGLTLDGKEYKKNSIEELPWQLVDNWTAREWVEPAGKDEDLQKDGDNSEGKEVKPSGSGAAKSGGGKAVSPDKRK